MVPIVVRSIGDILVVVYGSLNGREYCISQR